MSESMFLLIVEIVELTEEKKFSKRRPVNLSPGIRREVDLIIRSPPLSKKLEIIAKNVQKDTKLHR
jgi:hypothetical protein